MEVLANSSTGCLAEIHPEIDAFRTVELLQRPKKPLRELHHLQQLLRIRAGDCIEMRERRDHGMARRVWKQIEDHEVMFTAKYNKPLGIAAWIVTNAEDTRRRLLAP